MRLRIGLLALVMAVPLGVGLPSRAATVNISVSNFRFCTGTGQCTPLDFVYVRNPTGNGLLHQNALAVTLIKRTAVHAGDTVVWTYRDSFCDMLTAPTECPGHKVCFENGTTDGDCGNRTLNARSGPVTVSYTVPAGTPRRTLIRYFCNVNAHYVFGMTGALLVE